MSPDLQRILAALYERDTCEPSDRPKWDATLRRLLADAMQKQPGTSHDQFMDALKTRYLPRIPPRPSDKLHPPF